MAQEHVFRIDLNEEFPHLPNAPIVEAVIHWRARMEKQIEPVDLRTQLTERLPNYPECQDQQELHLTAHFAANGTSTQIRRDSWCGFRLTSSDKLHIAQFNRDGLVFSRLRPYADWESFSQEGQSLWKVFVDLGTPSEVQRLGVRFINRIGPVELSHLGRFLAKPPVTLPGLDVPLSGFLYQSTFEVLEYPYRINVVQAIHPPTPPKTDGFGLILDTDVLTTHALPPDEEILCQHLANMRWLKNKVFISQLKKSVLKKFAGTKT